jgi:hypothetical protein
MLRKNAAVLLAAAVFAVLLPAACRGIGLGVVVGEPTGVSLKQWLSARNAVDAALAWSFTDESAFHVHADYLYHLLSAGEVRIPGWEFYLGIGGRLKLEEDDSRIGVRVPFGMDYLFETTPFEFFLEVAPILDLAPATEVQLNGGFGIRYYFGRPWEPDLLS